MINIGHFEEIEKKIPTASVAELLKIRAEALADAEFTEQVLLNGEAAGEIDWREDAAIIYDYDMRFVAACSLRLAQRYGELENEG